MATIGFCWFVSGAGRAKFIESEQSFAFQNVRLIRVFWRQAGAVSSLWLIS